eukprot:scaffold149190_cov47-Prasinocladus_malaysianus.AAC.1
MGPVHSGGTCSAEPDAHASSAGHSPAGWTQTSSPSLHTACISWMAWASWGLGTAGRSPTAWPTWDCPALTADLFAASLAWVSETCLGASSHALQELFGP